MLASGTDDVIQSLSLQTNDQSAESHTHTLLPNDKQVSAVNQQVSHLFIASINHSKPNWLDNNLQR